MLACGGLSSCRALGTQDFETSRTHTHTLSLSLSLPLYIYIYIYIYTYACIHGRVCFALKTPYPTRNRGASRLHLYGSEASVRSVKKNHDFGAPTKILNLTVLGLRLYGLGFISLNP